MTKKITWRLKEQPSTESLQKLVGSGILSKEEAREILMTNEEVSARDIESYKSEIKFLRELVERLSNNSRSTIIETIKEVERPYKVYPWWNGYQVYCSTQSLNSQAISNNGMLCSNGTTFGSISDFTNITC